MNSPLFPEEKLDWLRNLLKQDAPEIYQRYTAIKARKEAVACHPIVKPKQIEEEDDFIAGLEKDQRELDEKLKNRSGVIWKEAV